MQLQHAHECECATTPWLDRPANVRAQRVKLLLEQTEQSARDLRASLAGVKKELVDRDRQLDVHRKMREHLAQEKAQLEVRCVLQHRESCHGVETSLPTS